MTLDVFMYGESILTQKGKKITKFDNPAGLLSQYYVGRTIGEIWGYVTDGYYTVEIIINYKFRSLRRSNIRDSKKSIK